MGEQVAADIFVLSGRRKSSNRAKKKSSRYCSLWQQQQQDSLGRNKEMLDYSRTTTTTIKDHNRQNVTNGKMLEVCSA